MFKKSFAVVGIAATLVLGGSAAAFAYPAEGNVTAGDASLTVGESTVVTATDLGDLETVFFAVDPTTGATLSSIVLASGTGTIEKPVVDGSASATFTANAVGTYTVAVSDGETVLGTTEISVTAAGSTPATPGLPATGGTVPALVVWGGIGAVALGGIAVAAVAARRRTQKN